MYYLPVNSWQLKQVVKRLLVDTPLRKAAAPVYAGAIAAELACDRRTPLPPPDRSLDDRVTIVIKTFERPQILERLVVSIRVRYPSIPIIVVDDSHQSKRGHY